MAPLTKTLARWGATVKAAFTMIFSRAQWGGRFSLGLTRVDYAAAVGDGRGNSIVVSVLEWIGRTFPEAPLEVVETDADGQTNAIANHPLALLLERPNPFYSGVLLWQATLADRFATGNAYWLKVRAGSGRPVELWWVPSSLMEPRWPDDGSAFISHYTYSPNGRPLRVEVQDVVHFRYGVDPWNIRKGRSPLQALLREIFTDDEAAAYTAALLRNLGVPGVVISPAKGVTITADQAEQYKTAFMQRFTGDDRGMPMVAGGEITVTAPGFSPEQMSLDMVRQIPESRIAGALGVPPIVVSLLVGLNHGTFSNYGQAREAGYEECIIPTQRLCAAELSTQLLDDFGNIDRQRIRFDTSQVRVLQDDQNALMVRAAEGFQKGILTRGEARALVGQASEPEDDVFALPATLGLVPRDLVTEAPAPAPAALPPPAEPLALPPGKGRKSDDVVRITATDVANARDWVAGLDSAAALQAALGLGKSGNGVH